MSGSVCVGIATRNRASLLRKALRSVLDQRYRDIEIVVIDDASTDDTPELQAQFPSARWIRTESRSGPVVNRNRLLRETVADYFVTLDDDAWFMSGDEIASAVDFMDEHPEVGIAGFDILSPDRTTPSARAPARPAARFIACGAILRVSAIARAGYFTVSPGLFMAEETDLSLRVLDAGYDIVEFVGLHVWHDKSLLARDEAAARRWGVCNDLTSTLGRCPMPALLWALPGKLVRHVLFAARTTHFFSTLRGIADFAIHAPATLARRRPVSRAAYADFRRRVAQE